MNNTDCLLGSNFQKIRNINSINSIKIGLASPSKMRSWSFGEVKNSGTINYRTHKPEEGGLFCCRIFGPIKDFVCLCGKYKQLKHRGIVCEKCNVEITLASARRERMAHIELAAPAFHIWFLKSSAHAISLLLDLSAKDIERILYFEAYVVIDPGSSKLKIGSTLSKEDLMERRDQFGPGLETGEGAEAIKKLLERISIKDEIDGLRSNLRCSKKSNPRLVEKLRSLESMQRSEIEPVWMVLEVLPVLPPELRPIVPLEGGRFFSSDLNDLYRKIINRNNRLKRLIDLKAPQSLIQNEKRLLQEAVDSLIDNGRRKKPTTGFNNRPLKSLSEMLRGKTGRFRLNLLGKRVDYSGRSVITVGPKLRMHQCGIPKTMALELFKPFVIGELRRRKLVRSSSDAVKRMTSKDPIVWDALAAVVGKHPILLNRAPTLHRASIQAFEPLLVEGNAIQLNPLVCSAFNADFDGDQMAVHIPLCTEAQLEARVLMLPTNNLLCLSNGLPSTAPSQEAVLGLYFLTQDKNLASRCFNIRDVKEVWSFYNDDMVRLNDLVRVKILETIKLRGVLKKLSITYRTTVGRALLAVMMPNGLSFNVLNCTLSKKKIIEVIHLSITRCGLRPSVRFIEQLTFYGFKFATRAGMSLCSKDFEAPLSKGSIISNAWRSVELYNALSKSGKLLEHERYTRIIETWSIASECIRVEMMHALHNNLLKSINNHSITNPVCMILDSSARGSLDQIKQISGTRGLMTRPDGSIMEVPITANFVEGLNTLQYFISAHGARKGLADTALKTANSGYLTRRLIDVAQDVVVTESDCHTTSGLEVRRMTAERNPSALSLKDCMGRYLAKRAVCGPTTFQPGTFISDGVLEELGRESTVSFSIRSPITCEATRGVCAICYGIDLNRNQLVDVGEAVGVIAAQSIGEPGTQLTMRTFHIGGTATYNTSCTARTRRAGSVLFSSSLKMVNNHLSKKIVVSRTGRIMLLNKHNMIIEEFNVPYGSLLFCSNFESVEQNRTLFSWNQFNEPIISEVSGVVKIVRPKHKDQEKAKGPKVRSNERTVIKIFQSNKLCARFPLTTNTIIVVSTDQYVLVGQVLAYVPFDLGKNKDITGGLLKVADVFEARSFRNHKILADADGTVSLRRGGGNLLVIKTKGHSEHRTIIPTDSRLLVRDNQHVKKGEALTAGEDNVHEILRLCGVGALLDYIISEVRAIYSSQNVEINSKHIEIIIRQMLRFVRIKERGNTKFYAGEKVGKLEALLENRKMAALNKLPATYEDILFGLTKAALSAQSFISAASFQETTKVLAKAASLGQRDMLCGLKENIIVGRMVPAGTGFMHR